MQSILFLMRYPLEDAYNLKNKFDGQMQACVHLGFDVSYLAYDKKYYYLCSVNKKTRQILGKTHFAGGERYRHTFAFPDMYRALARALKQNRIDLIYMRNKLVIPSAVRTLKRFTASGGRLVIEIPSYGSVEKSMGAFRDGVTKILTKSNEKLYALTTLFSLIGVDCPDTYKGKPAVEISNGVSLDLLPMKNDAPPSSEIHMLALASMRFWQGYDRVIEGLCRYRGEKKPVLHLVGTADDESVSKWMKSAEDKGISAQVIFHGPLYGEELSAMFDLCDLAIGTLAMHRKAGAVASALKVREYAARGIPFIYGYTDTGLTGNEWFAKQIAADESPVDFDTVIPWLTDIVHSEGYKERIRDYAGKHLSWETQFRKMMDRLEE